MKIKCKCPLCELECTIYSMYKWTGIGIPRMYCDACRLKVSIIDNELVLFGIKTTQLLQYRKNYIIH